MPLSPPSPAVPRRLLSAPTADAYARARERGWLRALTPLVAVSLAHLATGVERARAEGAAGAPALTFVDAKAFIHEATPAFFQFITVQAPEGPSWHQTPAAWLYPLSEPDLAAWGPARLAEQVSGGGEARAEVRRHDHSLPQGLPPRVSHMSASLVSSAQLAPTVWVLWTLSESGPIPPRLYQAHVAAVAHLKEYARPRDRVMLLRGARAARVLEGAREAGSWKPQMWLKHFSEGSGAPAAPLVTHTAVISETLKEIYHELKERQPTQSYCGKPCPEVIPSVQLLMFVDDVEVTAPLSSLTEQLSSSGTPLYGLEMTQVVTSARAEDLSALARALSPFAPPERLTRVPHSDLHEVLRGVAQRRDRLLVVQPLTSIPAYYWQQERAVFELVARHPTLGDARLSVPLSMSPQLQPPPLISHSQQVHARLDEERARAVSDAPTASMTRLLLWMFGLGSFVLLYFTSRGARVGHDNTPSQPAAPRPRSTSTPPAGTARAPLSSRGGFSVNDLAHQGGAWSNPPASPRPADSARPSLPPYKSPASSSAPPPQLSLLAGDEWGAAPSPLPYARAPEPREEPINGPLVPSTDHSQALQGSSPLAYAASQPSAPRLSDPRHSDSRPSDPRSSDPRPSDPRPSELDLPSSQLPTTPYGVSVYISSRQFALIERRKSQEYLFEGSEQPCVVGRSERAGCRLPAMDDLSISREHCIIRLKDLGGWEVLCLSERGLSVNQQRVEAGETLPLFDHDIIALGRSRFEFRMGPIRAGVWRREEG